MNRREVRDQIAKEMQHRAGIFFAEAAERAVIPTRIVRKERLQVRRILPCYVKLLGAKSGNAHAADIAVAPRLFSIPYDQIIPIRSAAAAALGFADAARRADDVDVTAGG